MGIRELRDRSGKLMGKIKELSSGQLEARDEKGVLKGRYDPRADQTRDPTGKLVGKGDLLASLLTDD